MPLTTKTWNQIVTGLVTALTSPVTGTAKISNTRSGSIALAAAQSIASAIISVYQAIRNVYAQTRLGTSNDAGVESYINDFGLTGLPATAATAGLNMHRNVSGAQLLVPPGGIVQTPVGAIQFKIIADAAQPAWNASLGAYVFGASDTDKTVTIQALVAGAAGLVTANTITQIVSGIVGIDSVTNPSGSSGGANAETSAAKRVRFVNFISSLSKATAGAIGAAIAGVQAGLTYQLGDALTFANAAFPGGFTAVVDDGSGAIGGGTITAITTAIRAVKALGIAFNVYAPTNVTVGVTVNIVAAGGYTLAQADAAAVTAITNYINTRGVGVLVSYSAMGNVIAALPSTASYNTLRVNTGTIDIPIAWNQLARAGTVTAT
jgi:uncharacterized phage protein gp47/JayE